MIDVAFAPNDLAAADVAGRAVVVIDVLRATTAICAALDHGARAVIPAAGTDEATRLAQALDRREVLLAGERNLDPIPGFNVGNSPGEMTADKVRGLTVVMSTTNGTRALLATVGAAEVVVAAAVNLSVAGDRALQLYRQHGRLLVLCAGRETGFGLDDAYIAGRIVIADRFELSTLAYQGTGRGLPLDQVEASNRIATGGLSPDVTILLDLPPEEGARRQAAAAKRPDRMEREAGDFHRRVAAGYAAAAERVEGVARVDAAGTVEEVQARVLATLVARFPETFPRRPVINGEREGPNLS